jgi:pimeloyl-ACP methyl ester carboxylesterase
MLIASSIILASAIVCTPILIATALISKLFSTITRFKPVDVSRTTFIKEMADYVRATNGLTSVWVCGRTTHVLCRHATVFSNYPPIVIIHGTGSCSFNYAEFMQSLPNTYDVYCIDLHGWGISEDASFDLETDVLNRCYAYYSNIIMTALTEICPEPGAKFMFIGHSFGAFILLKSIAIGYIPPNSVKSCIVACIPGLHTQTTPYQIIGAIFRIGIQESIFKQWWSKHLFSAFLYRKKTQLQTLQNMHRFIPNGVGYKLVRKQMVFRFSLFKLLHVEWINLIRNQLLSVANNINVKIITGIHDFVLDNTHTKEIVDESIKTIKYYTLEGGHSLFTQKDLFSKLLSIIDDSDESNKTIKGGNNSK